MLLTLFICVAVTLPFSMAGSCGCPKTQTQEYGSALSLLNLRPQQPRKPGCPYDHPPPPLPPKRPCPCDDHDKHDEKDLDDIILPLLFYVLGKQSS